MASAIVRIARNERSAMTNALIEPPASAKAPEAQPPPWRKLLAALLKLIPLIGSPLAEMVLDSRVGAVVGALVLFATWALLIYPLIVVLAVCWALQADWFPDGWRQHYVWQVRQGFRVDQAAKDLSSLDHQRLDYFQLIEMRKPAMTPQAFTLRIKPYQRLVIRAQQVGVVSLNASDCPLPQQIAGKPLFALTAGDIELRRLSEGRTDQKINVDLPLWRQIASSDDDEVVVQLELLNSMPAEQLQALQCASVMTNVRLAVEVFKDHVEGAPI